MKLGDVGNADAAQFGRPLDGIRVLAVEQMQALPFATQLLARFGADVIKVERPETGDAGRASQPSMADPAGHSVGATFLRNNLNKRSLTLDLKHPRGRELLLALLPHFDVFAENSRAGVLAKLGLGYEDIAAVHPSCIYVSVSGFGNNAASPYRDRPALAPVVEAMSGIYENRRVGDSPPLVAPAGALGDIGAGMFAVIGILAALAHRERTGEGQHVDVAMLDAVVAMTDLVTNLWSLGLRGGDPGPVIMHGFRAADGWFVLQVIREPQFKLLASLVGHDEWVGDPRFETRRGWVDHLEEVIRPAVETWASTRTKAQAAAELSDAGLAAGPCLSAEEVVHDPHMTVRNMLVEIPRTDGEAQPVITPGNPVKLSKMAEGPERRMPWLGEHTSDVLRDTLGLGDVELTELASEGII